MCRAEEMFRDFSCYSGREFEAAKIEPLKPELVCVERAEKPDFSVTVMLGLGGLILLLSSPVLFPIYLLGRLVVWMFPKSFTEWRKEWRSAPGGVVKLNPNERLSDPPPFPPRPDVRPVPDPELQPEQVWIVCSSCQKLIQHQRTYLGHYVLATSEQLEREGNL